MRDTIIAIHYQTTTRSPDFVFPLTIDLGRDGEAWSGTCLELGTSTFGDTLEEVRTELQQIDADRLYSLLKAARARLGGARP